MLEGIFGRSAHQRSKRQGWVDTDHLWISAWVFYPNVGIDLPRFSVNSRRIVYEHHVQKPCTYHIYE